MTKNDTKLDCGSMHCCIIVKHDVNMSQKSINGSKPSNKAESIDLSRNGLHYPAMATHCWGRCRHGECDVPFIVEDVGLEVAAAESHSCVLDKRQIISCFGSNDNNQLDVPMSVYY